MIVRDNEAGFNERRSATIDPSSGCGIGLTNTRERLQQFYGPRQSLVINRPAGSGLREVFDPKLLVETPVPAVAARPAVSPLTRFVVKESGRVFFVPVAYADWLEASGNYVGLRVGGGTHLIHETLANVEQMLDPKKFLRIHRSTIVNVDRIKELQPFASGEFVVILHDGTRLKLSRSFRDRANEVLGSADVGSGGRPCLPK